MGWGLYRSECSPLTLVPGHIRHVHVPHLSHVAQHGEYDEAWHQACQAVHQAGHYGVTGAGSTRSLHHTSVNIQSMHCNMLRDIITKGVIVVVNTAVANSA